MIETLTVHCASAEDTEKLAQRLSLWVRPGDLITLSGDLGSGKSTFARALIRALSIGPLLDVPSPTFTLVQSYDDLRIPIFHADLYRLTAQEDVAELGLGELLEHHAGLVEWPEKLPGALASNLLEITLEGSGETREITLQAHGRWPQVLQRDQLITTFLTEAEHAAATRHFLEGDASSRRYEWLETSNGSKPILMDMPYRPDGPPVRHGKPYSAIAHLAEGLPAVVAINTHLVSLHYSAPKILHADIENGLALIENLGDHVFGKMLLAGADMAGPMLCAAELLADMAQKSWPQQVAVSSTVQHIVPHYDAEALLIEVDLLPSWYWPYIFGTTAPPEIVEQFTAIWRNLIPHTEQTSPQWVMRDFHSPNLIWIPNRQGIARIGLIDTQDAVLGHGAYDLMSMTQDARVDIPDALAQNVIGHYLDLRRTDARFSAEQFMTAYAVLGAQRATKILGIFARLSKRDGKHGYLKHMPRVARALAQNLEHPVLAPLKAWVEDHLPHALRGGA